MPHTASFSFAFLLPFLASPAAAQCGAWSNPFGSVGIQPADGAAYSTVSAALEHDDGSGPAIFVGGEFEFAGGIASRHVARWNGTAWSSLDGGVAQANGNVRALARFDDGAGAKLYAGGSFTTIGGTAANAVARWDGSSWSAVGNGTGGQVRALVAFDDGNGSRLYAAGALPAHGGIAMWNGTAWTSPPGTALGDVTALAVHVLNGTPRLHAANADGAVYRREGTSWTQIGQAFTPAPPPPQTWVRARIDALASFQGELHVGGRFESIDGLPIATIARLTNSGWSPVGAAPATGSVEALAAIDAGAGVALFVGGAFGVGGQPAGQGVLRWNGTQWSTLGATGLGGVVRVEALASVALPALGGPGVVVGGEFERAGGVPANDVAQWSATTGWRSYGTNGAPDDLVRALTAYDDGTGLALYSGGPFQHLGATDASHVARWRDGQWTALPGTLTNAPRDMIVHDDGTGRALYVGASVTGYSPNVARWNGSAWSSVGVGLANDVHALCEYDDGAGPELYAGGAFGQKVARWTGSTWFSTGADIYGIAEALTVHDDGTGPALYAAFQAASISIVRRWDGGSTWNQVGQLLPGNVKSLVSFDDGTGARLVAGGALGQGDLAPAASPVWRLEGTTWTRMGAGIPGIAYELAVHDAGDAPRLYAAGTMNGAYAYLMRWTGSAWQSAGLGANGPVWAIETYFDGTGPGPALYVGGQFSSAGGIAAQNLARFDGCAPRNTEYCFGDGVGAACPCDNTSRSSERAGCRNSFGTGGKLVANGTASIASDTLVLAGTGMPNSTAFYFQGTTALGGGHGSAFGDGLRCAGGAVRRLVTTTNVAGGSQFPAAGNASVSVEGGATVGSTRYYQVYYRNAATYCTSATFNLTNGAAVRWSP